MRPHLSHRFARRTFRPALAAAAAASTIVALSACNGDRFSPAVPPTPIISVEFVSDNASAFTVLGDSWTWDVIVTRSEGYAGVVDLTVEGLPAEVTASFEPASLYPSPTNRRTKCALTFTASASAPVGAVTNVTIRASGVGVADATTVIRFTVAPPSDG